jgi:hypothetical protein
MAALRMYSEPRTCLLNLWTALRCSLVGLNSEAWSLTSLVMVERSASVLPDGVVGTALP